MKLDIFDYEGRKTTVDIGDLNDILDMHLFVLSGDEVLQVKYKNGKTIKFDSNHSRLMGFYDNSYEIYDSDEDDNILDMPEFLNRTSSYWYFGIDDERLDWV